MWMERYPFILSFFLPLHLLCTSAMRGKKGWQRKWKGGEKRGMKSTRANRKKEAHYGLLSTRTQKMLNTIMCSHTIFSVPPPYDVIRVPPHQHMNGFYGADHNGVYIFTRSPWLPLSAQLTVNQSASKGLKRDVIRYIISASRHMGGRDGTGGTGAGRDGRTPFIPRAHQRLYHCGEDTPRMNVGTGGMPLCGLIVHVSTQNTVYVSHWVLMCQTVELVPSCERQRTCASLLRVYVSGVVSEVCVGLHVVIGANVCVSVCECVCV